ncbi:MAG: FliM/FliN family flagellar motor switch protein [Rhodobacteraceae bacterium]|nr:FliM/FliN family flagellar motor switch protein [Paracoccaceae bacterium]
MESGENIIRRKIAAIGDGAAPPAGLLMALETALGKVAREMFDVDAAFEAVAPGDGDLASLLKTVPQPGLLMVLGTAGGAGGLICLDPLMVNAMVELMTGAGPKQVYRTPRVPTQIDAALCRDFVAALGRQLAIESQALPGAPMVPALSLTGHETDAARLAYGLAQGRYGMFSGKLAFQGGIRGGEILLALPLAMLGTARAVMPGGQWAAAMSAAVTGAPFAMRAVLDRVAMPIGQALDLKAGDLVPVPASALSDLTLESISGEVLFRGRLGQKDGRKAVCLTLNCLTDKPELPPKEAMPKLLPDTEGEAGPDGDAC